MRLIVLPNHPQQGLRFRGRCVPDDGDLSGGRDGKIHCAQPARKSSRVAQRVFGDQIKGLFGVDTIIVALAESRQFEQSIHRQGTARGDGMVLQVLGPQQQCLTIGGRIEKAASRVGKADDHFVDQFLCGGKPARVEVGLVEIDQAVNQRGIIVEKDSV